MIKTPYFDPERRYKTPYLNRIRSYQCDLLCGRMRDPGVVIPEFGCTVPDLRFHVEKQFQEGMRWSNRGQWEIDHIEPCGRFNPYIQHHVFKCCHWSNIRPIWAEMNHIGPIDKHQDRPFVDYERLRHYTPREYWAQLSGQVGQVGQHAQSNLNRLSEVGQVGQHAQATLV